MGAVMSFGQDPRWRRALVDAIDPRPVSACSTWPRVLGWSPSRSLARWVRSCWARPERGDARRRPGAAAPDPNSPTAPFVRGEAERLPFADAEFDALSFTYLLRYVDDRGGDDA